MKRADLLSLIPYARNNRDVAILRQLAEGATQAEVGRVLGLTRARINAIVKQVQKRANTASKQEANNESQRTR